MERFPTSDLDLFSDDAIQTPYPYWAELRDSGSAVWLKQHDIWVVARYDEVKAVLGNWRLFTTAAARLLSHAGTCFCQSPDVKRRWFPMCSNSVETTGNLTEGRRLY